MFSFYKQARCKLFSCVSFSNVLKVYVSLLKSLYDHSSTCSSRRIGPLATLHVDQLDLESIWEEIQTRNRPMRRFLEHKIKKLNRELSHRPVVQPEDDEGTSEESEEASENSEPEDGSDVEMEEEENEEGDDYEESERSIDEEEVSMDEEDTGDVPLTEEQEDEMEKYLGLKLFVRIIVRS